MESYVLPVKNVYIKPNFWFFVKWRLYISGRGRTKIPTSVKMFGNLIHRKNALVLMQCSGRLLFQKFARVIQLKLEVSPPARQLAMTTAIKK